MKETQIQRQDQRVGGKEREREIHKNPNQTAGDVKRLRAIKVE